MNPTPPQEPVTAERVAGWMLEELSLRGGVFHEAVAALEIVRLFGGDFCDQLPDGSFTISPRVRQAFDRLAVHSATRVLWDDVEHAWRLGGPPATPYR